MAVSTIKGDFIRKGDTIPLYSAEGFGRLVNARNQILCAFNFPKPIAEDVTTVTINVTAGFVYTGTTSINLNSGAVDALYINKRLGQATFLLPMSSTASSLGVATADQVSGSITFS